MRGNFSPMAEAARLASARAATQPRPLGPSAAVSAGAADNERWCEWPRRPASNPPFLSIRAALQAIQQARHA